eukprot:11221967-Karenia_brevis.AAC.1
MTLGSGPVSISTASTSKNCCAASRSGSCTGVSPGGVGCMGVRKRSMIATCDSVSDANPPGVGTSCVAGTKASITSRGSSPPSEMAFLSAAGGSGAAAC